MKFGLLAPRQEQVELLGSWSPEPLPLSLGEDGVWRTPELTLPDGVHRYKFRLRSLSPWLQGEMVRVTDPLARQIDERDEEASVVVIEGGQDRTAHHGWRYDAVSLPENAALVLYRLDIATFGGTFAEVIARLAHLKELGVNALALRPLASLGPTRGAVRHFCAPANRHGPPCDLKRLVDECHGRAMRVILELSLDAADSRCPLVQIDGARWFRLPALGAVPCDGSLPFDHASCAARRFVLAVARYWKEEFHLDGFHLQATRTLDSAELLSELALLAEEDAPRPFLLVAEHIPEDPAVASAHGPADSAWFEQFQVALVELFTSTTPDPRRLVSTLQPRERGYEQPELVLKFLDERACQQISDSEREDWALQREKLAASLLFLGVGLPLLHERQEEGACASHAQPLTAHYRRLAELRHQFEAIRSAELELIPAEEPMAIAFWRTFQDEKILVLVNTGPHPLSLPLVLPEGPWVERLTDPKSVLTGGEVTATLGAYEARVYSKGSQKLRESVTHGERTIASTPAERST